ncbi:NAD(P)/FAD-dependent oxidoreductase [Alicyclobacillus cycloheptanicus]|uniref:Thioredoxin reductase n=1 Tax=Alicyclobacillus cycloheptanicus TaxID=1457 RepID=A0ABT9XJ44_9BACL|nr:NAD(P)/FAD-dependent oxidoreductase [Alicyclobacillus cycloheptanicus]MDQ0190331.1 thioredoxin reductase [Alicyclobacillus cycloheptanicus]WDM00026.1 NAD(P)/FAD-dependent oxidoreductase [Alicyclobacillus cycloheptanicus]
MESFEFDCIIVGGGIAGLQAAIQLGRYCHRVLVLDANTGRSTLCRSYHNVLGWPDGVSGLTLRDSGFRQARKLGVSIQHAVVTAIQAENPSQPVQGRQRFVVIVEDGREFSSRTLLLATGVVDRIPHIPGLEPALGLSIYVCPDCDGYECLQRSTVILGAGDVGARMALTLLHWTDQLVYVNHLKRPVSPDLLEQLRQHNIRLIDEEIQLIQCNASSSLEAVVLMDGTVIEAERGMIAFGGNKVKSSLVEPLGVHLTSSRHIAVHPRTKMTSVPMVWAAGDVVAHSEQVTIAMGDGSQAAIFIHKSLLGEPVDRFQP